MKFTLMVIPGSLAAKELFGCTCSEDWYCPKCKEYLGGHSVTNDENCDACGTNLTYVHEPDCPVNKALRKYNK